MNVRRWASELKRRKVYTVALAYVSAAVVIVLATAELYDVLLLPDWTPRLVLLLLIAGLPAVLVLGWAYEVRPEGEPANTERGLPTAASPTAVAGPAATAMPVDPGLGHTPADVDAPDAGMATEQADLFAARPGIVVLPFDNLSPDASDAYFSDGLTEEIITNLSYLRGLRVISRNSAMALKGTGKDTRTIGRELDVRYVLEGSVRKVGDDLRITAQLIDARTDAHLWSKRYDGTMHDVFEIQESVARSIAEAMEVELSPGERRRLSEHAIPDSGAYQAYLRARQLSWQFTAESLARARQEMQNGLDLVGPNPLFYAGLALVHWALYDSGVQHDDDVLDRGEEYAGRALDLDPELPQAWLGRGLIRYKRGDMPGTVRDFRRAVELGLAGEAPGMLAFVLGEVGRCDEAIAHAETGVAGDPLSMLPHFHRACAVLFAGQSRTALAHIRDTHARLGQGDPLVGWFHAQIAAHAGEEMEAQATAAEVAGGGHGIISDFCRLLQHALAGDRNGVVQVLDTTDLRRVARTDEYYPVFLANNLTLVGEHEEALDWLEQAIQWGFTNHVFLSEHDRFLAPLREHPRFVALMETARRKLEAFEA